MVTCPGDLRSGIVSERLSWAVNPFAAQAATASEPLPSGIDWSPLWFGWPSTMSDWLTTPSGSSWNAPFCQAVVAVAAAAACELAAASPNTGSSTTLVSAVHRVRRELCLGTFTKASIGFLCGARTLASQSCVSCVIHRMFGSL